MDSKPQYTVPVWEHFSFNLNESGEPINVNEPLVCSFVSTHYNNSEVVMLSCLPCSEGSVHSGKLIPVGYGYYGPHSFRYFRFYHLSGHIWSPQRSLQTWHTESSSSLRMTTSLILTQSFDTTKNVVYQKNCTTSTFTSDNVIPMTTDPL